VNKYKRVLLFGTLMLFTICASVYSSGRKETVDSQSLPVRDFLSIATKSSKITVIASQVDEIRVEVIYTFSPRSYKPVFLIKDDMIELQEDFDGPGWLGKARWSVTVPYGTRIRCSSGSGDILAEGLRQDLSVSSGSGSVSVENCSSSIDVSTGSGKIFLESIEGDVHLSTGSGKTIAQGITGDIQFSSGSGRADYSGITGACIMSSGSGNIRISEARITGESRFSAGSGDVVLNLSGSTTYDLSLSTGSGNAVIDYDGNPIKGYFEFTAREDRGKIISPFSFDDETTFTQGRRLYMRKSVTRGNNVPQVTIQTGTGTAELRR
jgi:hypothetical protein